MTRPVALFSGLLIICAACANDPENRASRARKPTAGDSLANANAGADGGGEDTTVAPEKDAGVVGGTVPVGGEVQAALSRHATLGLADWFPIGIAEGTSVADFPSYDMYLEARAPVVANAIADAPAEFEPADLVVGELTIDFPANPTQPATWSVPAWVGFRIRPLCTLASQPALPAFYCPRSNIAMGMQQTSCAGQLEVQQDSLPAIYGNCLDAGEYTVVMKVGTAPLTGKVLTVLPPPTFPADVAGIHEPGIADLLPLGSYVGMYVGLMLKNGWVIDASMSTSLNPSPLKDLVIESSKPDVIAGLTLGRPVYAKAAGEATLKVTYAGLSSPTKVARVIAPIRELLIASGDYNRGTHGKPVEDGGIGSADGFDDPVPLNCAGASRVSDGISYNSMTPPQRIAEYQDPAAPDVRFVVVNRNSRATAWESSDHEVIKPLSPYSGSWDLAVRNPGMTTLTATYVDGVRLTLAQEVKRDEIVVEPLKVADIRIRIASFTPGVAVNSWFNVPMCKSKSRVFREHMTATSDNAAVAAYRSPGYVAAVGAGQTTVHVRWEVDGKVVTVEQPVVLE